jgi:phospholipase/carboxylesterase
MDSPIVQWRIGEDPEAPLVVLLHGWGEDEADMLHLCDELQDGSSCASLRAPYSQGQNHAWFAPGKSIEATCAWFEGWLDQVALERQALLVGFSAGAAFAGGALLVSPVRYLGAAMLCGTLPFEAVGSTPQRRLVGLEMFLAHKFDDTRIPRELLDRTWTYLTQDSGARCHALRYPGDHGLSQPMLSDLSIWLGEIIAKPRHP